MANTNHHGDPSESVPLVSDRTHSFVGRRWLFEAIDKWAVGQKQNALLIVGEPGAGKSSAMARFVELVADSSMSDFFSSAAFPDLAYYHFCDSAKDSTLSATRFTERFAMQLANRYPDFAQILRKTAQPGSNISVNVHVGAASQGSQVVGLNIQNLHVGRISPREAYDQLVRKPLEQLYGTAFNRELLVLIDGLDESLTFDAGHSIAEMLTSIRDLPPQVRFLLTSRPDHRVLSLMASCEKVYLTEANTFEDINSYCYERFESFGPTYRSQFALQVAAKAKGNFLYAYYVTEDLLKSQPLRSPQRIDSLDNLPSEVTEIYAAFLGREIKKNKKEWNKRFRPLLGSLAVARDYGLTKTELAGIHKCPRSIAADNLASCAQYLSGTWPEGPFRIYHQSFRDYLLANWEADLYLDELHAKIGKFFVSEYAGNWNSISSQYAIEFTVFHLTETVKRASSRKVRDIARACLNTLAKDLTFLEEWLRRFGIDSLLQAMRSATSVSEKADVSEEPWKLLADWLDRDANDYREIGQINIAGFLAQQIGNRAVGHDSHFVNVAQKRLKQLKLPHFLSEWRVGEGIEPERVMPGNPGSRGSAGSCLHVFNQGTRVIARSNETELVSWEISTGKRLSLFSGHTDSVTDVKLTKDEKYVVSGSHDGTVRIWDLSTGAQLRVLSGHAKGVTSIALTPDGTRIISGSADRTLKVWRLSDGCEERTYQTDDYVMSVSALLDSRRVVSCSVSDDKAEHVLQVWDIATGLTCQYLRGHTAVAFQMLPMPDGKHLVTASDDGTIRVWDVDTGKQLRLLKVDEAIRKLVLFEDSLVAAGCDGGTVKVWDLQSKSPKFTFEAADWEPVRSVAITPDGSHLFSGSWDHTIRTWDLGTGSEVRITPAHSADVGSICIAGDYVISGSGDGTIKVWRKLALLEKNDSSAMQGTFPVKGLTVAESGNVCGYVRGTFDVLDLDSGKAIRSLGTTPEEHGSAAVAAADFSVSGKYALLAYHVIEQDADEDEEGLWYEPRKKPAAPIAMFDVASGGKIRSLIGHESAVKFVAMRRTDEAITCGSDHRLIIWNTKTGKSKWGSTFPFALLFCMGVSRNGLFAVTAHSEYMSTHSDAFLVLWSLEKRTHKVINADIRGWVNAVAVSESGDLILSAHNSGQLRVWNVEQQNASWDLPAINLTSGVQFLPGDDEAVSGSVDGVLTAWTLKGKQAISRVRVFPSGIESLAIHGKSGRILVGGKTGGIACFRFLRPSIVVEDET
jgi:WD40 repeat protein